MTPTALLSFLHVAEKLKSCTRHNWNTDGRQESVADHSWRLALLAELLRPEFPNVDMDRVVTMCLFHDLGEAITGDIPTFEKTKADEKIEEAEIFSLLRTLPEPECSRFSALFREMLAMETTEARLCKALDRFEAVIAHNEAPIESWLPLEYDLNRTYAFEDAKLSPCLMALRQEILRETEEKITAHTAE